MGGGGGPLGGGRKKGWVGLAEINRKGEKREICLIETCPEYLEVYYQLCVWCYLLRAACACVCCRLPLGGKRRGVGRERVLKGKIGGWSLSLLLYTVAIYLYLLLLPEERLLSQNKVS